MVQTGTDGDGSCRACTTGPASTVLLNFLGSLREVTVDTAQAVGEAPEWEELIMVVDSGASVTVINSEMAQAVTATEPKPHVKYEVADGSLIENMGQKTFNAVTDCGVLHKMTAQVTDVKKALLSVGKLVKSGNRMVFDEGNCFIENKVTKQRIPMEENNGSYALEVWIHRDQSSPF